MAHDETKRFNAIVVGAGPGGSSCATFLSKTGVNVLLLDKEFFPRDKICGDGISARSLDILRELGVLEKIESIPLRKISGFTFSSPDGTLVDIPIPKRGGNIRHGYAIRRLLLDNLLFQNAKEHSIKTMEGFTVTGLIKDSHSSRVVGVEGTMSDGQKKTFYADVIVGADGVNSIVARETGARHGDIAHLGVSLRCYYRGVGDMKGNLELHFLDKLIPGYFWILPMANGFANVGIGIVMAEMRAKKINLKNELFRTIENNPVLKDRFKDSTVVPGTLKGGTIPFGSKRWKAYGNGWLLVGDAASLVNPFTGEGIENALYSGRLVAAVISEAYLKKDYSESQFSSYEHALKKELDPILQNSYQMQKRSRSGFLLNLFMHKAARNQKVRDLMASTLTDVNSRQIYSSLFIYLRMVLTPPYW
ncbi:MAG: Geranylgeranyl reductase [Thermoproteota archaeon]|nr:Geranylgeranyl reductase [Thermoproteota archaeon]